MGSGCCFRNASCVFECNRPGSRQRSSRWWCSVNSQSEDIDGNANATSHPDTNAYSYSHSDSYGSSDSGSSTDQCHVR